eukprot:8327967-Ditylum_brightwellii.AAC.1
MLKKDAGNPKITCLQIIVIVKGNMNGVVKAIWDQRLVPVAEKTNFLSTVQLVNRKGHTSLDALLLKVVTVDCLQSFCLNDTILNNNDTTCYDRMIPEISALHL